MSDSVTETEHLAVLTAKGIVLCNPKTISDQFNTLHLVTDLCFSLKCSPSLVFAQL